MGPERGKAAEMQRFLRLKHTGAAHAVRSTPQPNPGLPGFGQFKICRKRASPQPAGVGLGGGGRAIFSQVGAILIFIAPPPSPALPYKGGGSRPRLPLANSVLQRCSLVAR